MIQREGQDARSNNQISFAAKPAGLLHFVGVPQTQSAHAIEVHPIKIKAAPDQDHHEKWHSDVTLLDDCPDSPFRMILF